MLRQIKLQPKTLIPSSRSLPRFSSSSSSPPSPEQDSAAAGDPLPPDSAVTGESTSPPPPNYSSYFKDIKDRLKSPPSPPRRIPTDPPPPLSFAAAAAAANPPPAASLEDIRKNLAEFRLKSVGSASGDRRPSGPPLSYRDFLKRSVVGKPSDTDADASKVLSFDAIRESLKKIRISNEGQRQSSTFNIKGFQDSLKKRTWEGERGPQLIDTDKLPDSIIGRERGDKKGENEQGETKALRTEFVKMYDYKELGEKLQKLRPDKESRKGDWFSLTELNERLAKLRELEEKETESRLGGVSFKDLRESLQRLKEAEANKKANMHSRSIFGTFGLFPGTPTFMLKPPQEGLLENYFHPDHMSSAEKLKLNLKKVRDEFKMSESDCGSARVQVAQLTTKIKHLSTVLHKKDKHSRKGLHEMVQHRKQLLKYLRRTDWDSYCLVLSKLGLRDIPEYKTADYKS